MIEAATKNETKKTKSHLLVPYAEAAAGAAAAGAPRQGPLRTATPRAQEGPPHRAPRGPDPLARGSVAVDNQLPL